MCSHKDFVTLGGGTTIHGTHLNLYKCIKCGCLDYNLDKGKKLGGL